MGGQGALVLSRFPASKVLGTRGLGWNIASYEVVNRLYARAKRLSDIIDDRSHRWDRSDMDA